MGIEVINLLEKAAQIKELHKYKRLAVMNDYEIKVMKAKRDFVWHKHPKTDELFLALEGSFDICLRDKTLTLNAGEMAVIPKNVEHKPVCREVCTVLMIEPIGTPNTGDAGGPLTDSSIEDI